MADLFSNDSNMDIIKERVRPTTFARLTSLIKSKVICENDLKTTDNDETFGLRFEKNDLKVNACLTDAAVAELCDALESSTEAV
jgi:hypothetical protein